MKAEYATKMAQSQVTTNTAPKFEHFVSLPFKNGRFVCTYVLLKYSTAVKTPRDCYEQVSSQADLKKTKMNVRTSGAKATTQYNEQFSLHAI